jgi:predicted RNA-binding Zn ribbon-like protein
MAVVRERENAGVPPIAAPPLSVLFANTVWAERGKLRDAVDTAEKLASWLGRHRPAFNTLTDPAAPDPPMPFTAVTPLSAADLAVFLSLRDAVRVLMGTAVDEAPADEAPADPEAVAVLNRCAARVPAWPELIPGPSGGGFRRQLRGAAARPADAALAALAWDAIDLLAGENLALLRACRAPGCVQYFIKDHPRRNWCSPSCGNRARVANHYVRTRAASQQPDT